MTICEKNLCSLKKTYPLLYENLIVNNSIKIELNPIKSKEGSPTIQLNGIFIHSRFDPYKEANKFITQEVSSEAGLVIIAGFGLAYHIESFLKTFPQKKLIIIEPDVNLFLGALELRDFSQIIESPRSQFLIGSEPEDCAVLLENYPNEMVQLIKLRSVYYKDEKFYLRLDQFIKNYISRKEINISTLKRFGSLWVRNLAANAHLLAKSPGIQNIYNLFQGIPSLIIAAGPSLDNIRPHLKELAKRFLIVCVDTSLRVCLEENVEPDFTVVVDPQYWNSRHLDRCICDNTILLSETSTYPTVFRHFNGKTFLCSTSFPLGSFLETRIEKKGKLKAGGSVATAAWDLCRVLSCSEIWCAGLDLGFPNKQTHCKGSLSEQRVHWLSKRTNTSETFSWHALNDAGLKMVLANDNSETWTDKRMSIYSNWFEEQMESYKSLPSWNLSDCGVKISGMHKKEIIEALKFPIIRHSINKKIIFVKSIMTHNTLDLKLKNTMNQLIDELNYLKDLSFKGIVLSQKLIKLYKSNSNLEKELKLLNDTDLSIMSSMSKDIAGFILQDFISELLKDKKDKNGLQIIDNSLDLYKKLHESSVFHIKLLKRHNKKI